MSVASFIVVLAGLLAMTRLLRARSKTHGVGWKKIVGSPSAQFSLSHLFMAVAVTGVVLALSRLVHLRAVEQPIHVRESMAWWVDCVWLAATAAFAVPIVGREGILSTRGLIYLGYAMASGVGSAYVAAIMPYYPVVWVDTSPTASDFASLFIRNIVYMLLLIGFLKFVGEEKVPAWLRALRRAVGFLAIIAIAMLMVDYVVVQSKEHRLSSAVSNLGGRMGSLPAWPLGTEYRITFYRPLNQKELDQLEIANRMRGWVGIAFQDCELSEAQMSIAREALPACHLFIVRDDEMVPIP